MSATTTPPRTSRPFMVLADDDPSVLSAIERDMRNRYAESYDIVSAPTGESALDLARELKRRGAEVALFLVDQRMPGMNGLELLQESQKLFPDSRRVLLTAFSETSVAIQAINEVGLHHYLVKPWHPPEEELYPTLDDLLADWQANRPPPTDHLVRVLGHRWSPVGSQIKEFLAGNRVPYRFLDLDRDSEAEELLAALDPDAALPAVVLPDGAVLPRPSARELAERTGLTVAATGVRVHDLVILGAGPAGLAAAVYGSSEGLDTVVVERWTVGGQAGTSSRIENYLGFPGGISGSELARKAHDQALRFNAEILAAAEAVAIRREEPISAVCLADGTELRARSVLVATGMTQRTIQAPGFERLTGAGVYYGATNSEISSFKGERAFVVGGANSAGQAAVKLASVAESVTIVVRASDLAAKMSAYLVDQIASTSNIHLMTDAEVVKAEGDDRLTAVVVRNNVTGEETTHPASGMFILIGAVPHTEFLKGVVELNESGFVLTGPDLVSDGKPPPGWHLKRLPYMLETSAPGIFAAGDVRNGSIRRVAAAVGSGAASVTFIHEYLSTV
ncbi:MAG TPA: FAD-dependent oxidoreductase [Acidimicrobiia bacterium]|nr:FAD-dependent oxidoreductase [Acidimicrobiia bacterium]